MCGVEIIRCILYVNDVVLFCKSVIEAATTQLLNIISNTCSRFWANYFNQENQNTEVQ